MVKKKEREREEKIDEGESDWEINSKSTKGCANRKRRTEMILLSSPRRCEVVKIGRRGSETLESNADGQKHSDFTNRAGRRRQTRH